MRHYSKEFREEAVKLADDIGMKQAAKNLGVNYNTLAGWRKERKDKVEFVVSDRAELGLNREQELERKVKELERTVDILSGAVDFFVNRQKK